MKYKTRGRNMEKLREIDKMNKRDGEKLAE